MIRSMPTAVLVHLSVSAVAVSIGVIATATVPPAAAAAVLPWAVGTTLLVAAPIARVLTSLLADETLVAERSRPIDPDFGPRDRPTAR